MRKRLIIGMSGASGAPLTIELLKQLQQYKEIIEIHLIVNKRCGNDAGTGDRLYIGTAICSCGRGT